MNGRPKDFPTVDGGTVTTRNHGTIATLTVYDSPAVREWIEENVDTDTPSRIHAEPRYLVDILQALVDAGLVLNPNGEG